MIGQNNIKSIFNTMFENEYFPKFTILTGDKGSGKKTFINECICPGFKSKGFKTYLLSDVKVDSIREMITMSYQQRDTLFIIPDADTMSGSAQNSMLKVVEECPHNNYYVMTLQSPSNTLPTILSRASMYSMDIYTQAEILEYYKGNDATIIAKICNTPGDVDMLVKYNVVEFWEYVRKVVDNIALVTGANSFKIAEKVALKEDAEGYDLKFFWKAFMEICVEYSTDRADRNEFPYLDGVLITSPYLSQINIKGINRQMLFDTWILDIRKAWMQWM